MPFRLSPESNIPSFRRTPESRRATCSLFFWIPAFAGMTKNGMIFSSESLRVHHWLPVLCLLIAPALLNGAETAHRIPLLDDTRFQRGVVVHLPAPGKHVAAGTLTPFSEAEPLWNLVQWHSRFSLAGAQPETIQPETTEEAAVRFFDGAKTITFYPKSGKGKPDLALGINALKEYDSGIPKPGDPWTHLLLERTLTGQPALTEIKSVHFHLRFRIPKQEKKPTADWNENYHTAQFLFYMTVQNLNRNNPGYGDYYWYGVPMYDARYRHTPEHQAVDLSSDKKQGTGKFIFNLQGKEYFAESAHDGEWITIDKDILPQIIQGLESAWKRGYLPQSQNLSDYHLTGINIGWEVTGPMNVTAEIADFSIEMEPLKSNRL